MSDKCTDERKNINIAQVPAVVKAAIEKETAGCTIKKIVKKEADGKTCYAVECVKNGVEKKLKFTEEGSIVTDKGEKPKSGAGTSCC
ncbi:hypothetical protein KsCSTR_12210 [Candidatus Kuenenia stuttgartiensis]|uniref:PepSY domain-containing protein n=1 Tax=Kuenenia stuttgartiensis TaxID=174633 RepID=Q1PY86_KUEST|nr:MULTISPECIES: hypothetical protein [Kuenenia]MBE7547645.1 hypothetical protein [Planctomycetia bacterium]MBZ0191349.1 hypothetical protein [Candidatus Kuenenia stuttgartiensis]MCF6150863.1 hypothetical protein [Candidatus Kuenenia stuttgartiensis]MCL4727834.1 hypothetical protein [Candidatus Kuenenia stuttgartiensis]MCZ7624372.1 hypothetical protein [Candidatus Kuenenia sp.]